MAILKADTFPNDTEGRELVVKIRQALKNLCGKKGTADGAFKTPPKRLRTERDMLRENWREIWQDTTIQYNENESGASVNHKTRIISIGGFFLRSELKILEIEKVLLHEFLHLAIAIEMREFHHSQMTQIITYNLGYPGDANPFGTD